MEPIPLNGKPNPFGVTHIDAATEEEILKARAALRSKRVAPAPPRKPKDDSDRAARLARVRAALDAEAAAGVTVGTHPNLEEENDHDSQ